MKKIFALIILAVLMSACSGTPEREFIVEWDKTADHTSYKTFAFQPTLGIEGEGFPADLGTYIRTATIKELTDRGYVYSEENPDLIVDYALAIEKKTEEKTVTTARPKSAGVGGVIHDYNVPTDDFKERKEIIHYREGTLRADVIDVRTKKLFWECIVIGKLNKPDPKKLEARATDAVKAVWEKWTFTAGT